MAERRNPARPRRRKSPLRVYFVLVALLIPAGLFLFHQATGSDGTSTVGDAAGGDLHATTAALAASVESGKALAGQYCQSCHQLPDPSLLDAATWKQRVLPTMGPRLGILKHGPDDYSEYQYDKRPGAPQFPSSPLLDARQWQSIIDYYVIQSPARLPAQVRPRPITVGLPLFTVEAPPPQGVPFTSLVRINEGGGPWRLMISNGESRRTRFLDDRLGVVQTVQTAGPIVDTELGPDGMLACNTGELEPNYGTAGTALLFRSGAGGRLDADPVTLFGGLRRPVQISRADLNHDGRTDFVVCEFGALEGGLSWMEATANGTLERRPLIDMAGAVNARLEDCNGDGLTDVWALFAQGQEGVFLLTNKGDGKFRHEQVLQFPPSYGSTHLELADFNGDGHADLLYTAGDNGDWSRVLKPYHGVYVYLNDGANRFRQAYFFPIHGCYKALARDFDGDGDLDVATVSAFPDDPTQPEEGFVYLENVGNLEFRPFSVEQAKRGRWMSMDAGDADGDGDIDLLIGNFAMPPAKVETVDWSRAPAFLLLRNNTRSPKG